MVRWASNRVAGGDAPWGQDPYGFGRSGELEDSEEARESWVQTTVTGENGGHPYRVPVKQKIPSPDRNYCAFEKQSARPFRPSIIFYVTA